MTRFILEQNYRPLVRAVETEAKPRHYQDATGISRLVEAVAAKADPYSKVFRIESEEGVLLGVGMLTFGPDGLATIPYLRLRHASVEQLQAAHHSLLQIADTYAPLYHQGLPARN